MFQHRIVLKAACRACTTARLQRPQIGGSRSLAEPQLLCHLAHRTALFMGQAQDISDARSSCLLPSWHGLSRFADERAKYRL
ncbi:MAG: hypothetical protein E5W51_00400, partial [Mesorhizobium sp.]